MKNVFYLVLVILGIAFGSCKKDDPQPQQGTSAGTPLFTVNGIVNGTPITINAGANGYFMSSSFELDTNGVYNFVGELKPKVCTGKCGNILKIAIKDYELATTSTTNIDSTIVSGFYSYASISGTASQFDYTFKATPPSAGIAKSYTWNFGDNSILVSYTPTVTHTYKHPGVYTVTLNLETFTGCISSSISKVQFGQNGGLFNINFVSIVTGDTTEFKPIPLGGVGPYTCVWDFGDGNFSNDYSPSHIYNASGQYTVSLKMTDFLGLSSTQISYVTIKNTSNCSSFFIPSTSIAISNPLNLGNAIVEWTDASGKVWSSNSSFKQPSNSLFQIISVTDYLNSSNGTATKKIHVQFSCTLYNGLSSIVMKNIDATFSVGYK
jgi:PKD repeat protein